MYGGPKGDRTVVGTVEGRAARIMAWAALAIVLMEDGLYVALIRSQPDQAPDAYTVPFVAVYLLLMAALLGASLLERPEIIRSRTALRAGAAGGLLILGLIAVLSIGLPLILAGALATGSAVRTLNGRLLTRAGLSGLAAAIVAIAVLVAGFETTERIIVCPATGTMSGSGPGFVTGPYQYECVDGHLSFHSG